MLCSLHSSVLFHQQLSYVQISKAGCQPCLLRNVASVHAMAIPMHLLPKLLNLSPHDAFQVVDTEAFARRSPEVDFDVNNLKFTQMQGIEVKATHGQRSEALDKQQILANIQGKQLYVLRPVSLVNGRIEKMKARGWKIMFPNQA